MQKRVQYVMDFYMNKKTIKSKQYSKIYKCPVCHKPAILHKVFCGNEHRLMWTRDHSVIAPRKIIYNKSWA